MRIPAAQLRQVDAPLQLMHALSFHFSRTLAPRAELRQPPPPLRHTQVALWPAQRARIMPGVTAMTCHRFSTAPASFNVYYRTASSWKALCLSRVMSGNFGRLQVRAFVQNGAVFVFIIDARCSTFGWEARRQQLPHFSPPPPLTASVSCRLQRRRASQANPTSSTLRRGAILNSSRTTLWRMRAAFIRQADSTFANCWPALPQPMQLRSIFLISVISGDTALISSSSRGHLETTRFLVESGANVEAKNVQYYTP